MGERWFLEYRLSWIKESVEIFGNINRGNITEKFGISVQQASHDIGLTMKRWPNLMIYNSSAKRYERQCAATDSEGE